MNWATIWINLFGTTSFLGIDMGFWVGMGVVSLIVIIMNVVFGGMKSPKATDSPTCFKTDFSANKTPSLLSFDWKAKVFINICGY